MYEAKETMTRCPICSNLFVEGGKSTPRILPCAHSLCESCIDKILKRNCVSCRQCGKRHRTTQGAESFPVNEYILLRLNNSGRREDQGTEQVVKTEIVPFEVKIEAKPVVAEHGMQSPVVENQMQVKNEPEPDATGNGWTSCPICNDPFVQNGKCTPRLLPCGHTGCEACLDKSRKRNCVSCGQCRKRYRTTWGARLFPVNESRLKAFGQKGMQPVVKIEIMPGDVKNKIEGIGPKDKPQSGGVNNAVQVKNEPQSDDMETEIQEDSVQNGMQPVTVENGIQVNNEFRSDAVSSVVQAQETKTVGSVQEDSGIVWETETSRGGVYNRRVRPRQRKRRPKHVRNLGQRCKNSSCTEYGKCTMRLLPFGHKAFEACMEKSFKRNCVSCGQCGKRHRTMEGAKSFPVKGLKATGPRAEQGTGQAEVKKEIQQVEVKNEVGPICGKNGKQVCVMENTEQVKKGAQTDVMENENAIHVKNKFRSDVVSPVVQGQETKPVVMDEDDIIVLQTKSRGGRGKNRRKPREFKQCPQHARDLSLYCKNTSCAKDICQLCILESHKSHDVIDILQESARKVKKETRVNVTENEIQSEIRPIVMENTIQVKNEVQSNVLTPVTPVLTKEEDDDVIVLACICNKEHTGIVKPKKLKINDVQVSVFDLDNHYSRFPCMKSSKDEFDIEDEEYYLPDLPSV